MHLYSFFSHPQWLTNNWGWPWRLYALSFSLLSLCLVDLCRCIRALSFGLRLWGLDCSLQSKYPNKLLGPKCAIGLLCIYIPSFFSLCLSTSLSLSSVFRFLSHLALVSLAISPVFSSLCLFSLPSPLPLFSEWHMQDLWPRVICLHKNQFWGRN